MSICITNKNECCGCEACVQTCAKSAIRMQEDEEGFRYPVIDKGKCIECGLCDKVCIYQQPVAKYEGEQKAYGGSNLDTEVLKESTSGGAFSAIVEEWCDKDYVIFGARAAGLNIYHTYITDKQDLHQFRKSKYSQSIIGQSFSQAKQFLKEGKKVLFSGTPCQIAALRLYLGRIARDSQLLTVEVICEGVPSPLFIRKYEEYLKTVKHVGIAFLDYRHKDGKRWDYEVMQTILENKKEYKCDRWRNPFWSIWLDHLMSRPSCYQCPFTTNSRVADITLGDLWGVHLFCPDLYNKNRGASLIITNTSKGDAVVKNVISTNKMEGHSLDLSKALRFQGPMRRPIPMNDQRSLFMSDLLSMDYPSLCKKWAHRPGVKLLISKYVWGTNRQKVILWNIKKTFSNVLFKSKH